MDIQLQSYKRRYDKAKSIALQWYPLLEACYHYCIPNRDMFYQTDQSQGEQKNVDLYDTTQISAVNQFVSKIHDALTPSEQNWAIFEAAEDVPKEMRDDFNKMLQFHTDVFFSYIRGSNFNVAIAECYFDLAIGTACLVCNATDNDEKPLRFSSIPLQQLAIEESINHICETCFRTWGETRIADLTSYWPRIKLSADLKSALSTDPNACVSDFVEAVIYDHSNKVTPYTYIVWYKENILLKEQHESSEFIIFRWTKINNEIYGRGPIISALPSIISLQTVGFFEFTASNLNICRPLMAYSDGVFNSFAFRLTPNTIIPVAPNTSGNFPIQPLPSVSDPSLAQFTATDLRQQINALLFANPLGAIDDSPTRTATELSLRQRNLAEEIGPLFTRLQQEFLDRVVERVMYILHNKGLMDKTIKIQNKEVKIRYKSPLTMSQGQQEVKSFMGLTQMLQGIVGPEMSVSFMNTPMLGEWLAERLGVDANLINSEKDMRRMFEEQQQKQQEQEQMAAMGGEGPPQSAGAPPEAGQLGAM